jgi:hypothetical protein
MRSKAPIVMPSLEAKSCILVKILLIKLKNITVKFGKLKIIPYLCSVFDREHAQRYEKNVRKTVRNRKKKDSPRADERTNGNKNNQKQRVGMTSCQGEKG